MICGFTIAHSPTKRSRRWRRSRRSNRRKHRLSTWWPQRAAEAVGIENVQVYGLTETECLWLEKEGMTVFRVVGIDPSARTLPSLSFEPSNDRPAVLDVGGGGSGKTFAWELLDGAAPPGTFIAGGVGPANISELMKHRPYGVDLSSGVESSPGIKDRHRLQLFFENLERCL